MTKNPNVPTNPDGPNLAAIEAAVRGTIDVLLGRGRTGKTTWARWAIERARAAGRSVAIADGDRNNATLGSFYPDASSPAASDDVTVAAWMEEQAESNRSHPPAVRLPASWGCWAAMSPSERRRP